MSSTPVRRVLGLLAAIALVAAGKVVFDQLTGPPAGSYQVTVRLGHAGNGLDAGSDVKVRGILVGQVTDIRLGDNAQAVATLTIFPGPRLPADVTPVVTSKTFLGEKQVELRPAAPRLTAGDPLAAGAVLETARRPTEVEELLTAVQPVVEAIDPAELAAVVDTLGAFDRADARIAGRNIELGARLTDFGAETAAAQLDRLSTLADITGELSTVAGDVNRLNASLPRWVSVLPDRQPTVRTNLERLAVFSRVLNEFLQTEEDSIADVLEVTTTVNGVLAGQADDLSRFVFGVFRYAKRLGTHNGVLVDGTDHGWFRAFVGGEGQAERLCDSLPPAVQRAAPGCVGEQKPVGPGLR